MGNYSLSGTFTALPDPEDFQPYPLMEVGHYLNGKPIRQGYESGVLKFPPLPSAAWNELRARWEANKDAQVSGAVPGRSGYGFRAMSGWWHEPLYTGWEGPNAHGVTMVVSRIGYY